MFAFFKKPNVGTIYLCKLCVSVYVPDFLVHGSIELNFFQYVFDRFPRIALALHSHNVDRCGSNKARKKRNSKLFFKSRKAAKPDHCEIAPFQFDDISSKRPYVRYATTKGMHSATH